VPRELAVPGRELGGVHLAMEFLEQQNRRVAGDALDPRAEISARQAGRRDRRRRHRIRLRRHVPPAGRRGGAPARAAPAATEARDASTPWPLWPMQLRTSHAHEEGGRRDWQVMTTRLSGEAGRVRRLHAVRVEARRDRPGGRRSSRCRGARSSWRRPRAPRDGFTGAAPGTLVDGWACGSTRAGRCRRGAIT
jgi:glutamate synthase (NADPH/NADH) small chain